MKRILCLALALAMALSLSACGGKPAGGASSSQSGASGSAGSSSSGRSDASSSSSSDASSSSSSSSASSSSNDDADLDPGDMRITIPAKLMGGNVTQEQLDEGANKDGVKTITLNDDGSVTYVMTKERNQSMLDEIGSAIDATVEALNGDGAQPGVVSVEANDDYSEFTVTLNTETVGTDVSFMAASLFNLGDTYQAFSGKGKDITVKYVNEGSGKVIQESSSKVPQ